MQEVMRFYPVVHFNEKMAAADTTLKLSHPLVMKDGTSITELPCTKGTIVYTDILSYNFSTEIFGSDADQFRPERWANPITAKTAPSVYAGLFNFIAGPRYVFWFTDTCSVMTYMLFVLALRACLGQVLLLFYLLRHHN